MAKANKEEKFVKSRKRNFPVGRLGAHVKGGVSPTFTQFFRTHFVPAVSLAKA